MILRWHLKPARFRSWGRFSGQDVSLTGSPDLDLLDCGSDYDCTQATVLTGGGKVATRVAYIDGTTDLTAIRAQKQARQPWFSHRFVLLWPILGHLGQEFGMLEFRLELPDISPRRFQIRVPANYVTDTASPTALTGPSAAYAFAFDVGMPYGQEVLPATWTTALMAPDLPLQA